MTETDKGRVLEDGEYYGCHYLYLVTAAWMTWCGNATSHVDLLSKRLSVRLQSLVHREEWNFKRHILVVSIWNMKYMFITRCFDAWVTLKKLHDKCLVYSFFFYFFFVLSRLRWIIYIREMVLWVPDVVFDANASHRNTFATYHNLWKFISLVLLFVRIWIFCRKISRTTSNDFHERFPKGV